LAASRIEAARNTKVDRSGYETVTTLEALKIWIDAAFEQGFVAFDTETNSLNAMQADLVGISLALEPGKACYIPLAHSDGDGDMFGGGKAEGQIDFDKALQTLKPLLESTAVLKIAQNMKYDWLVCKRHGIEIRAFDDTMLLSYVSDAGKGTATAWTTLSETAGLGIQADCLCKEVDRHGAQQALSPLIKVAIDKATAYAAEDADITLRLWNDPEAAALWPRSVATVYEAARAPHGAGAGAHGRARGQG
jgi:DNA polymerase-1